MHITDIYQFPKSHFPSSNPGKLAAGDAAEPEAKPVLEFLFHSGVNSSLASG